MQAFRSKPNINITQIKIKVPTIIITPSHNKTCCKIKPIKIQSYQKNNTKQMFFINSYLKNLTHMKDYCETPSHLVKTSNSAQSLSEIIVLYHDLLAALILAVSSCLKSTHKIITKYNKQQINGFLFWYQIVSIRPNINYPLMLSTFFIKSLHFLASYFHFTLKKLPNYSNKNCYVLYNSFYKRQ